MWRIYLAVLASNIVECINRPTYKIVLTQKGFTQFLQYDVDTPPMREFTMCVWIRVFELTGDQSIFTYFANGNKRVIRLWLDAEQSIIKVSINGKASSSTAVDISEDTWHHVCLSYQSDFGAWALYMDGRLASCEAAQSLNGYVIPGGGSFVLGYGTTENGNARGLEGEIFGVGILLISTIEGNHTIKRNPQYQQKPFIKNKLNEGNNNNIKYTVLEQEVTSQATDSNKKTRSSMDQPRNFFKFNTPYSHIEYDIGVDLDKKTTMKSTNNNNLYDFSDFAIYNKNISNDNAVKFSDIVDEGENIQILKPYEQISSSTKELSTLSEFETPPPIKAVQDNVGQKFKYTKKTAKVLFEKNGNDMHTFSKNVLSPFSHEQEILDQEVPPPVEQKEKVYGQWTTSSFANDVLNYLKSVNGNNNQQRQVPTTIPLLKVSDNFPYSSDFKASKIYAPHKSQRRIYHNDHPIRKREIKHPQINVEILESDLRSQILKEHANTFPQNVEIKNRGRNEMNKDHRFYRNIGSMEDISESDDKQKSFPLISKSNNQSRDRQRNFYNSLMNILPFLKSNKYITGDYENNREKPEDNNKMYTKNLSNKNKWHNVKSYSNDFAPREFDIQSGEINQGIDNTIAKANRKQPSIRLKYKPEQNVVKTYVDNAMDEGRMLATKLSNLSKPYTNTISNLKLNQGSYFNQISGSMKSTPLRHGKINNKFDQHVKLGNALNERGIIGGSGEDNMRSFIGGNKKIPDINRYRSDIDNTNERVPPSLGPRVCKNVELYDRLFYVQPDESIDVSHILSPVKDKNLGIQYIMQNYRKCSLKESVFERHPLLLINWSKTPLRLFGGAYAQKTTDLCGFF